MEEKEPIVIRESEIGKFIFQDLLYNHGFCIDKDLEEAISISIFDYLVELGVIDDVVEDDEEEE